MQQQLVTVICLCYNHERFVKEAIESVFQQTYPFIQLIVVDDASSDNSVTVIRNLLKDHPDVSFIYLKENVGNCKAFNKALPLVKGDFIIDLAADDVLLPDRIQEGVDDLQTSGKDYGVHYSDAAIISEEGIFLCHHSDKFPHHTIPHGDIYKNLVERYFICSPTVMYRRVVIEELNGYDEALAFEDFDFWIRSSRKFKYVYSPVVLIKKRLVSNSMSQKQFTRSGAQRWSTLAVCRKIKSLNKSEEENIALKIRLRYELVLSLKLFDFKLAFQFFKLRMSL